MRNALGILKNLESELASYEQDLLDEIWRIFPSRNVDGEMGGITVLSEADPSKSMLLLSYDDFNLELPLAEIFLSELVFYEDCAGSIKDTIEETKAFFHFVIERMEERLKSIQ